MKTIDVEELKNIQLDVVKALHDFCVENKIKYSLACGSLLGAIRHNGYIPWDDDIDVYLEREDYNRLITLFPKSYKGIYEFVCLEKTKWWRMSYGKLYDNRTIMYENSHGWIPIGVNIDVFPVDTVPDNPKAWNRYNKFRKLLQNIYSLKVLNISNERSVSKNIVVILGRICLFLVSSRFIAQIINKYAQYFNNKKNAHCLFENVQGLFQKKAFDKEDFSETILHKFEDKELFVMKGYDHCLKCGFGNYMKLPPIEKRVSHHSFTAYWKDNNN